MCDKPTLSVDSLVHFLNNDFWTTIPWFFQTNLDYHSWKGHLSSPLKTTVPIRRWADSCVPQSSLDTPLSFHPRTSKTIQPTTPSPASSTCNSNPLTITLRSRDIGTLRTIPPECYRNRYFWAKKLLFTVFKLLGLSIFCFHFRRNHYHFFACEIANSYHFLYSTDNKVYTNIPSNTIIFQAFAFLKTSSIEPHYLVYLYSSQNNHHNC